MKNFYGKFWASYFTLVLLVGCASLGFVKPETFTERLAAGYIAHTAVLTATTNALNAHDITSDDAASVQKIANEARRVLDAAKLANDAGDIETAQGRLSMGVSLILQLQNFLREKRS